jgi:GTPase
MTSVEEIVEILRKGEARNMEFKRNLTKTDLKSDRRQKLVTRVRYMTCETPFEGLFLIGIEDLAGKTWEVYGLTERQIKTAEAVLVGLR